MNRAFSQAVVKRASLNRRDSKSAKAQFTIGTLVNNQAQYDAMRHSMIAGGFTEDVCEFLYIDNTGPQQTSATTGLNAILDAADANIIILCHQDIRLLTEGRDVLEQRLAELSDHDSRWAIAGNAGGMAPGQFAIRITDPYGTDQRSGPFPARVTGLDENFLIVRRASRVGFSHDFEGFHLYGSDICLHAAQMGCTSYVIDFHIQHLSPGKKDASFYEAKRAFLNRWARALQPRWLQTTYTLLRVTSGPTRVAAGEAMSSLASKVVRRWPRPFASSRAHDRGLQ